MIYNSFIVSNFNYCPLVWHFTSVKSTKKMERIQERALRFIYHDYTSTVKELLINSKCDPLHVKRMRDMGCEVFRIVNKISPDYIQDLITLKHSNYNFRQERTAEIRKVNTSRYGQRSFSYGAAQVWNSLPNEARRAENFCEFKRLINTWADPICACSICKALL